MHHNNSWLRARKGETTCVCVRKASYLLSVTKATPFQLSVDFVSNDIIFRREKLVVIA